MNGVARHDYWYGLMRPVTQVAAWRFGRPTFDIQPQGLTKQQQCAMREARVAL